MTNTELHDNAEQCNSQEYSHISQNNIFQDTNHNTKQLRKCSPQHNHMTNVCHTTNSMTKYTINTQHHS